MRTIRRTVLLRATATAMLLLGWLVTGCAEKAGVTYQSSTADSDHIERIPRWF